MAIDPGERVVWLVGPQAEALRTAMPPPQQEVTRCFASLAELPSLDQVRLGEYPELLGLDVTVESEAVTRIPELCRAWLTSVLALAPDYETAERCLLAGADDVVVAPWTPAEVWLRARRLLHIPTGPLRAGDLVLNLATRDVRTWYVAGTRNTSSGAGTGRCTIILAHTPLEGATSGTPTTTATVPGGREAKPGRHTVFPYLTTLKIDQMEVFDEIEKRTLLVYHHCLSTTYPGNHDNRGGCWSLEPVVPNPASSSDPGPSTHFCAV
jgi:hypothetical protein